MKHIVVLLYMIFIKFKNFQYVVIVKNYTNNFIKVKIKGFQSVLEEVFKDIVPTLSIEIYVMKIKLKFTKILMNFVKFYIYSTNVN